MYLIDLYFLKIKKTIIYHLVNSGLPSNSSNASVTVS